MFITPKRRSPRAHAQNTTFPRRASQINHATQLGGAPCSSGHFSAGGAARPSSVNGKWRTPRPSSAALSTRCSLSGRRSGWRWRTSGAGMRRAIRRSRCSSRWSTVCCSRTRCTRTRSRTSSTRRGPATATAERAREPDPAARTPGDAGRLQHRGRGRQPGADLAAALRHARRGERGRWASGRGQAGGRTASSGGSIRESECSRSRGS